MIFKKNAQKKMKKISKFKNINEKHKKEKENNILKIQYCPTKKMPEEESNENEGNLNDIKLIGFKKKVQSISNDLGQSTNLISERFKFII
jgi:hypothetical protein